ncbi:hypothetical protein MTR_4g095290 [Medicago truncatula]|uniref:Uncharacterized protein n=1 Tax=Medicago truncatula TaxID=3880 RepID=G7JCS8_MEDTR|nr:hypothetical protein MTR_4g095290 [Medicago truncatula]
MYFIVSTSFQQHRSSSTMFGFNSTRGSKDDIYLNTFLALASNIQLSGITCAYLPKWARSRLDLAPELTDTTLYILFLFKLRKFNASRVSGNNTTKVLCI